jgi:hypothetical protein
MCCPFPFSFFSIGGKYMNVNCVLTGCGVLMYAADNDTYCAAVLGATQDNIEARLEDLHFRLFSSSAVDVDVDAVAVWNVGPGPEELSVKPNWALYANLYGELLPLFVTESQEVCEELKDWIIDAMQNRSAKDELLTLDMRELAIETIRCMADSRKVASA